MRLKFAMGPWWVQGLAYALFFGVAIGLFYKFQDGRSWPTAAAAGAVTGLIFGVLMGVTTSRINRRLLAGLDRLTPSEAKTVARAVSGGPAPTDPRLRETARGLVQRRQSQAVRTRGLSVAVFALGTALYVLLALTQSWWWWLAAAAFIGFLILTVTAPARLGRRFAALSEG